MNTPIRLLQRQILPADRDADVLALYVDPEDPKLDSDKYEIGSNRSAKALNAAAIRQSTTTGRALHPDQIESRTAIRIKAGTRLSFATYFNAFPASYWRRWSVVSSVRLTVTMRGAGSTLIVYKSMARGHSQRIETASVTSDDAQTFSFELTLKPFVDGGWYWYDVVAGDQDVVVESAEWTAEVPAERTEHGTVDIAITTMNRPDFCAELLVQLGDDPDLDPYLDEVLVMEQGTDKVTGSEVFPRAEKALGQRLRVIEQGNLGGSGGYARGQFESVRKGTATYTMMMDDDVVCEPEGVIRAITFADLARRPTMTFPGAAVWHIPWTDKNDALDWQAYFHLRNRFVAALLHSQYPRGGRMIRESLNHQIAHLVSMQYSTAELRLLALEDVLAGPEGLHDMLPRRLAEVNALRKQFPDAQLESDPDVFPPVRRKKPPRRGKDPAEVPGRLSQLVSAGLQPLRQLKAPRELARQYPESEVRAMDAKWYRLGVLDSAIVSMNDGASAAFYRRDPELFRDLMKRTIEIHERLYREWPRLSGLYREQLGDITSPQRWEKTFAASTEEH